jgi:ribosomal protein L19
VVLKNIENQRLINSQNKKKNYIKYISFIRGDFITIWYINREKEKGNIRYQYTRGVCLSVKYKKYNSTFIIRSIIKGIGIEQNFCYHSLNNIYIKLKKNIIRNYIRNKLLYLRIKKNKQSRYII